MTRRRNPLSRIRLVYRRSRLLTKAVVLAAIVLSTAALLTLRFAIQDAREQTEAYRVQAAELEQENDCLEQYIEELGSVQSVERIARQELGLVDPDTVVFIPEE